MTDDHDLLTRIDEKVKEIGSKFDVVGVLFDKVQAFQLEQGKGLAILSKDHAVFRQETRNSISHLSSQMKKIWGLVLLILAALIGAVVRQLLSGEQLP